MRFSLSEYLHDHTARDVQNVHELLPRNVLTFRSWHGVHPTVENDGDDDKEAKQGDLQAQTS